MIINFVSPFCPPTCLTSFMDTLLRNCISNCIFIVICWNICINISKLLFSTCNFVHWTFWCFLFQYLNGLHFTFSCFLTVLCHSLIIVSLASDVNIESCELGFQGDCGLVFPWFFTSMWTIISMPVYLGIDGRTNPRTKVKKFPFSIY